MTNTLKKITQSPAFNRLVVALIVLSGLLVGLETYPRFSQETTAGQFCFFLQKTILWLFVVEIGLKIGACGSKPWQYFMVPWNLFDFAIVAICFLPFDTEFAAVMRMARLLRAVRLLTILPRLQVLVSALLESIPSLGYVGLMLFLHFYVYAVLGTFLFSGNDPIRFGNLHSSMMTLFEVLTLEGWNDVFNTQSMGSDAGYEEQWKQLTEGTRVSNAQPGLAAAYFVSFILVGTMIMLNLFTGVIINSMEQAQAEANEERRRQSLRQHASLNLNDEIERIVEKLQETASEMSDLKGLASQIQTRPETPSPEVSNS